MPRAGLRQRANRGRPRVLTRPGATLSVRGESKPGADHGVQPQDARVPRWIWIMGLRKGTIRHPAPLVRRFERQPVHGGSNAAETGEQTGPEVHLHRFQRRYFRRVRSEEHTSELQSQSNLVCRLLLEKKKK